MEIKRLMALAAAITVSTGCNLSGLNLTSKDTQTINKLLADAGLSLQVSDSSGNQRTISQSDISSVTVDGQALKSDQYSVDTTGQVHFKNVFTQGDNKVKQVVITLSDGSTMTMSYDPSKSADVNKEVFIPSADGTMHQGDPTKDLSDNFAKQHQEDLKHRITIHLGISALTKQSFKSLGFKRPNDPHSMVIPPNAVDPDGSGSLAIDAQVLNLLNPPNLVGQQQQTPGGQGGSVNSPTHGPQFQAPAADDIKGAAWFVVYQDSKIHVFHFKIKKTDFKMPSAGALPDPQDVNPADLDAGSTSDYNTIDAAKATEGFSDPPPQPGPVIQPGVANPPASPHP